MTNKRTINVLIFVCILFLALIAYLTYFEIFMKDEVSQNPYNQRQWLYEEDIVRGSIYDCNGTVLAKTENQQRIYPYDNLYSHVIGYHSKTYGKSMLEAQYNSWLLGQDEFSQTFNLGGVNKSGYDMTLTIDHQLQSLASQRLGNRNGSVVALKPKTGEVLALVSKPDFNPNSDALAEQWNQLIEREDSPLLPRATSGLYAPGSTFKMITAAAAIEAGYEDDTYTDYGFVEVGDKKFENQGGKSYGKIDLTRGFAVSSNVVFCLLGEKLGKTRMVEIAERFGFNRSFHFDLPLVTSQFPTEDASKADLAALGIGQGEMLATPMQMAMVTSAIANNGTMMKPYLVKNIKSKSGLPVMEGKSSVLYQCLSEEVALQVKDMMVETVKSGTGASAAISGIQVAGKTGTAENERSVKQKGKEHTWFVSFAPAEDPEIAVAVMMEYSGGSGSENCAPIARALMKQYLEQ